jgi:hypothetical protein
MVTVIQRYMVTRPNRATGFHQPLVPEPLILVNRPTLSQNNVHRTD